MRKVKRGFPISAPSNSGSVLLESKIKSEIKKIEREILLLEQEKDALSRNLIRIRRENVRDDVNRINSVDRIVIENRILEYLSRHVGYSNWKNIYNRISASRPDLNENTFRTYLHRLKLRGLIEYDRLHNGWALKNNVFE